jgi:hypothetical protein
MSDAPATYRDADELLRFIKWVRDTTRESFIFEQAAAMTIFHGDPDAPRPQGVIRA